MATKSKTPAKTKSPCGKLPKSDRPQYRKGQILIRLNPEVITPAGFAVSIEKLFDMLKAQGAWIEALRLISKATPTGPKLGILVVNKKPVPGAKWGIQWFVAGGAEMEERSFASAEVRTELRFLRVYFPAAHLPSTETLTCIRIAAGVRYVEQLPIMRIPDVEVAAVPPTNKPGPPTTQSTAWFKSVIGWDEDELNLALSGDVINNIAVFDTGYSSDSSPSVEIITTVNKSWKALDSKKHGQLVADAIQKVLPSNCLIASWKITGGEATSSNSVFHRPPAFENASPEDLDQIIAESYYYTSLREVKNSPKIQVVNISHGGSAWTHVERELLLDLHEADITVVASSGNASSNSSAVQFPAGYESVVSVGGCESDSNGDGWQLWSKSRWNWDPAEVKCLELKPSSVELIAPAVVAGIGTGTSFAAPIVSALLGIIRHKKTLSSKDSVAQLKTVRMGDHPQTSTFYDGYGRGILDWATSLGSLQ